NGFQCPSDPDQLTTPWGHNNYMGNAGSAPNSFYGGRNGGTPAGSSNGAFGPYAGVFCFVGTACDSCRGGCPPCDPTNTHHPFFLTFGGTTDGLPNTAGFSERIKGRGNSNRNSGADLRKPSSSMFDVPGVPVNGNVSTGDGGPFAFYNVCKAI